MSYCLKCKKKYRKYRSKSVKTKNGRLMLSSKRAVCDSEKLGFRKQQQAKAILSSLGIKTSLSQTPLFGDILL